MSFRRVWTCLLLPVLALAPLRLTADDLPSWTPIGPEGGLVQTLATSPALPGTVYAGLFTNGFDIWRGTDRGQTWSAASPVDGHVLDLTLSADGAAVYAAAATGLLRSTDGGATWLLLPVRGSFSLVQAHPRRPGMIFAVQNGILLRSTDGGASFQAAAGPDEVHAVAFSSGARVAIYAGGANGLWRSTDAGQTWRNIDLGLLAGFVRSIAVDPRDPHVLYVGLMQNRNILKSTDGGATWEPSRRGLPAGPGTIPSIADLAVDPANSSIVYTILEHRQLFRSVNGGRTWARVGTGLPARLLYDLETTGYGLLAGTSAGVFLSTDRGLTWRARTAGMTATSITGLALDTQDPARLYAGDANAGLFKTIHRGRPWLYLGDPYDPQDPFIIARPLQVDPEEPLTVYAGTGGAVMKSTNGGRRWSAHGDLSCLGVTHLLMDLRETSRLYAAGRFATSACGLNPHACIFYRSADAGETWQCVGGGRERLARPLGIDPFTSAVYAQSEGHLLRSTDAGTTWTVLFENLSASSFAASPLVQGTLWAGGSGMVRRSRDGGSTWQDFSAGLPTAPIVALAPDPAAPGTLYAAAAEGVFKSTDAGETWKPVGTGLAGLFAKTLLDLRDRSTLYVQTLSDGLLRLTQRAP